MLCILVKLQKSSILMHSENIDVLLMNIVNTKIQVAMRGVQCRVDRLYLASKSAFPSRDSYATIIWQLSGGAVVTGKRFGRLHATHSPYAACTQYRFLLMRIYCCLFTKPLSVYFRHSYIYRIIIAIISVYELYNASPIWPQPIPWSGKQRELFD